MSESGTPIINSPFARYRSLAILLLLMLVMRLLATVIRVPEAHVAWASLLMAALFMIVPIIGLFYTSRDIFSVKESLFIVIIGILIQVAFGTLLRSFPPGFTQAFIASLGQMGLLIWCFGLSSLLMGLIKDKNLLAPIAFFLAGFDVFLVANPAAPTRAILEQRPEIFESMAYSIPRVVAPNGPVGLQIGANMGPADLLFLSLFFVAIHRFGLRANATLRWMVPVLIGYLFVVLLFGDMPLGPFSLGALPVLLPIGAVILVVNWRCFDLKRDEIIGTVLAAALGLGLAGYGIYRASLASKAKPVAPLKKASAPTIPKLQDSPVPKSRG